MRHFKWPYPVSLLFVLLVCGLGAGDLFSMGIASRTTDETLMEKALPVWAQGRKQEMNLTLGFRGVFSGSETRDYRLKITASTLYRLFLNGEFLGYGPARAAHGWFRVDEYDLGPKVRNGENVVAIEVAGYNVNTYYTIDVSSFLQAEVTADERVVLATGPEAGFEAFEVKSRLQKTERYSFQRPFTEYYRLTEDYDKWRTSTAIPVEPVRLALVASGKLLKRNLAMPEYEVVRPVKLHASGEVEFRKPEKYYRDRSLTRISPKFKGYRQSELEVVPSQMIQEIVNRNLKELSEPYAKKPLPLKTNEFVILDLGTNLTGFMGATLTCREPSTLCFHFDEVLTNGDVNSKKRMADVNNQVIWELAPGTYTLESFEAYTMKYLKVILLKGSCELKEVYLREYAYPLSPDATFASSNDTLDAIYAAARQTYRQNSVDIFMDCPSRERAGWLCDSYFSAIMERDFTGDAAVARNFYENYALLDHFDHLPEGMIPMCYPADHPDSVFITNWSMWFILQIDDFARRGGDPLLVARLKPRITNLLGYFEKYENRDGLLENLGSWIFVEWSKANEFVRDVNYPSNMLYSAALASAARLYGNDSWLNKSEKIRNTILKQAYDGTFFVDNAVRDPKGKLKVTRNTTEVCQYYAFFFGIATPETHPALWHKLIHEFGPLRDERVTYPAVFRANAFVGNYMRLDVLSRYGLQKQLLGEVKDYFYYMAARTGTLWENTSAHASCNHGFASYIGHLLYRDVLGIREIDREKREVTIRFSALELERCRGSVPVEDGVVELVWEREGKKLCYTLKVPENYRVKIENPGSLELVSHSDTPIRHRLIYNCDGTDLLGNFMHNRRPLSMADLHAYVDTVASTPVTTFMICSGSDFVYYRSKYGRVFGDDRNGTLGCGSDTAALRNYRSYYLNHLNLENEGSDLIETSLRRASEKGMEAFITYRMNDLHFADTALQCPVIYPDFWIAHPEYWLNEDIGWHSAGAPDFAIKEVRNHKLAIITEQLEKYGHLIDGYDLDFMRFMVFFRSTEGEKNAPLMTDLVREVRARVDETSARTGKKILLSVRVPPDVDFCLQKGLDVREWVRQGLVDFVSIGIHWIGNPSLPVATFRSQLGYPEIPLYASIDDGGYKPREFYSHGMYRGMASRIYGQGGDGIYLFNYFFGEHMARLSGQTTFPAGQLYDQVRTPRLLHEIGSPEGLHRKNKIYCLDDGGSVAYGYKPATPLPLNVTPGKSVCAEIFVGDDVQKDKPEEQILFVRCDRQTVLKVSVNGTQTNNLLPGKVEMYGRNHNLRGEEVVYAFLLPASTLQKGDNHICLQSSGAGSITVMRLEVALKYGDPKLFGYF